MKPETGVPGSLDERLRRELEPDAAAVERVVARALAAAEEDRAGAAARPRWSSLGLATAAGALLAGAAALWIALPRSSPSGAEAAGAPPASITSVGSVLVVRLPDGRASLVHSAEGSSVGPSILVLTQGAKR
jgi:hypothetical protein